MGFCESLNDLLSQNDLSIVDGATNDRAKVCRVLEAAQADVEVRSVRRLGAVLQPDKSRPILVTVRDREERDLALNKAKV